MKELTKEEITSLADALQHGVLAVQRKQAAQMLGVSLSIFDRLDIPFIYYLDRLSLKRWRVSDLKAFVDEQAVGRRRDVKDGTKGIGCQNDTPSGERVDGVPRDSETERRIESARVPDV